MQKTRIEVIFANNLKRLISSQNISVAELATILGLERTTIYRWFRYETFPSPKVINQLLEYFKISPYELLTEQSTPENPEYQRKITILEEFIRTLNKFK
jgi:transcriptional regulator with XRE-family HTH domain